MGGVEVCSPGLLAWTPPLQKFPWILRQRRWCFWSWWGHLGGSVKMKSPFLLSGFQSSMHGAGDERHGLAGEDAGTP